MGTPFPSRNAVCLRPPTKTGGNRRGEQLPVAGHRIPNLRPTIPIPQPRTAIHLVHPQPTYSLYTNPPAFSIALAIACVPSSPPSISSATCFR